MSDELFNPISGATLNLPDLMTIPYAKEFHKNIPWSSSFSESMIKAIAVSSSVDDRNANDQEDNIIAEDNSSADLIVAAIFKSKNHKRIVAICRPKVDKKWTMFRSGSVLEEDFLYEDILFHNGKLSVQLFYNVEGYEDEERLYNDIGGNGKKQSVTLNNGTEVELEFLDDYHHKEEG